MNETVTIIVAHRLGKDEAVSRLKEGLANANGRLGSMIAIDDESWQGDTLRFRMRHADGGPANADDGLRLRLASDDGTFQENVPIDAAGLLTVQRSQAAYDADATFILNRKNGLYTGHPEVRTAGLPDNVRRLGDLRLECRVTIAIVKEQMPFMARAAINAVSCSPAAGRPNG